MSNTEKKIKRFRVTYHAGKSVTHYDGVFQPANMALCGADLMGDNHLGWHAAKEVNSRVTCEHCLMIIKHVKKILNDA